jgi:hypothetical protein
MGFTQRYEGLIQGYEGKFTLGDEGVPVPGQEWSKDATEGRYGLIVVVLSSICRTCPSHLPKSTKGAGERTDSDGSFVPLGKSPNRWDRADRASTPNETIRLLS